MPVITISPNLISSKLGFGLKPLKKTKLILLVVAPWLYFAALASAQYANINMGPDAGFARIDFSQIYLDQQNREMNASAEQRAQRKQLVDSGVVSALDLAAPNKAVEEFNHASSLLKAQKSKEAIGHLQKALSAYPKFVSAHNALGLAYLDQEDARAKEEFETAAKLDTKFPGSFLNLGLLALGEKDFGNAEAQLEKAAAISPTDTKILSALAFAQNGDHQYQQTLQTAQRVHALEHRGLANVHYVAASAAVALNDLAMVQNQLSLFLSEDPTNPLAPTARQNLDILIHRKNGAGQAVAIAPERAANLGSRPTQSFPNSERLEAQLNAAQLNAGKDESSGGSCETCTAPGENNTVAENNPGTAARSAAASGAWTIRQAVDETAVFFAVSNHGHMVSDLQLSDIQVRDNDLAPQRILQFVPQSKLPLRLALLIDTSGSVHERFKFEKRAAEKFLQKVLNGTSDLGFVAGFSSETAVTQDFVADPGDLAKGIEKLTNGGGTALFDAVSFACWKLAAYPEQQRVARVLVVLTDGEDNSSHRSLKQSIQDAETAGVTIYMLSTREDSGPKTDADKILDILAERSGGEAMFPGDILALDKSLDKLHDLIRSRYLIAYKPAAFEPNGKYRTLHITAERSGQRLQVHARKGYYARLETNHN